MTFQDFWLNFKFFVGCSWIIQTTNGIKENVHLHQISGLFWIQRSLKVKRFAVDESQLLTAESAAANEHKNTLPSNNIWVFWKTPDGSLTIFSHSFQNHISAWQNEIKRERFPLVKNWQAGPIPVFLSVPISFLPFLKAVKKRKLCPLLLFSI